MVRMAPPRPISTPARVVPVAIPLPAAPTAPTRAAGTGLSRSHAEALSPRLSAGARGPRTLTADDLARIKRGELPVETPKFYTRLHVSGLPALAKGLLRQVLTQHGGQSAWVADIVRVTPLAVHELLVKTSAVPELKACLQRTVDAVAFPEVAPSRRRLSRR